MKRRIVGAWLWSAALSGIPSTVHALATGGDPFQATAAAGTLIVDDGRPRRDLIVAAIPAHLAVSLLWTLLLAAGLPKRGRVLAGALAGVAIHLFDMNVVGRAFPRIAALPRGPQLADHIAFGLLVGKLTEG